MLHVGRCWAKFETSQTSSYVQTDATAPNIVGTSSNESKSYLHVANVLGDGGRGGGGKSSVGLILWADTRVPIIKKTRGSSAQRLAVLTQGKL